MPKSLKLGYALIKPSNFVKLKSLVDKNKTKFVHISTFVPFI